MKFDLLPVLNHVKHFQGAGIHWDPRYRKEMVATVAVGRTGKVTDALELAASGYVVEIA